MPLVQAMPIVQAMSLVQAICHYNCMTAHHRNQASRYDARGRLSVDRVAIHNTCPHNARLSLCLARGTSLHG